MRDLKFRAWDGKKVFYPDSLMFDEAGLPTTVFQHHNLPQGIKILHNKGLIKDLRIMQYTGRKDKNGVEVCEGDIVRLNYGSDVFQGDWIVRFGEHEIDWHTGETDGEIKTIGFYLESKFGSPEVFTYNLVTDIEKLEIIGNIYENPELLK